MEPSTSDLPFLVVHGAWLWPAAIAALIAGTVGGLHLRAWRRARFQARAIAEGLDVGGDRNVRGRLGGPRAGTLASILYAEPRRGTPHTSAWYVAGAWLETPEGRVLLEGPVHVVAGSRAAASRNGVPRMVSAEELETAAAHAPWIHRRRPSWEAEMWSARFAAVAAGDEVVATGEALERAPAPSGPEADYREGRAVWKLRGSEDAPIRIAARAPRGAVLRMSVPALVVLAAVLGLGSYGLMRAFGPTWRRACNAPIADPDRLSSTGACALAAAMPESRRAALSILLDRLEQHPVRDERSLGRILGLAELAGGCGAVVERLLAHDRYEEAAAAARACGDPAAEREALVRQGRFEEAAALALPGDDVDAPLSGVELSLAAGRWADAAKALEVWGNRFAAPPRPDEAEERDRRIVYFRCLAELVRHTGGDAAAPARLRRLHAGPHGDACAPMVLEIADANERSRLALEHTGRGTTEGVSFVLLAWSRGMTGFRYNADAVRLLLGPEDEVARAPIAWLIGADPAKLPEIDSPDRRSQLLSWVAVAQVLDGDVAGAARTASEAGEVPLLQGAVELYAARRGPLASGAGQAWSYRLALRNGRALPGPAPTGSYEEALNRAADGDGRDLANQLLAHGTRRWSDSEVLAVWPRIEHGRDELARQLAWAAPPVRRRDPLLWSQAIRASMRRTALAAAGATAEAGRWDAVYRRYDAMLADRRRVVALILARP